MNRKWTILLASMGVFALGLALCSVDTIASPSDDENPLHKLMEKVNKTHNSLRNAVKTPVAYKKAGTKQVMEDAEALLKLAKESRDFTEPAKTQKKTQKEWTDATDVMIKTTGEFIGVLKAEKGQAEVKKALVPVTKSCTDCHAIFRVDEDF